MSAGQRYLHQELTGEVIAAFYDVYNALGSGFREAVYEQALQLALGDRGIRAERQRSLRIRFHGRPVGLFRAGLVVEDAVVIELKARPTIERSHTAQLLSLLRAAGLEVGLLLNFGPQPQIRRLILSRRSHGQTLMDAD